MNHFFKGRRLVFKGNLVGTLEQRMLFYIWQRGSATAREVVKADRHRLADTTIRTTLDRLFRKGLLERSQEGRAFRYKPVFTREDFFKERAADALQSLFTATSDPSMALSFLVNKLGEGNKQRLRDLERLVEAKRREIDRRERGRA